MRKNVPVSTGIVIALILLFLAWEELSPPSQFIGGSVIGLNKKLQHTGQI